MSNEHDSEPTVDSALQGDGGLSSFVARTSMAKSLRVEDDLGDGFVRLLVDEAERRQARHDVRAVEDALVELLRNARDAGASFIYVASSRDGNTRRFVVIDDGVGIPPRLHDAVFEPRVTSKLDSVHMDEWGVHGRGMALFSIRENAVQAQVVASVEGKGTAMLVDFDTTAIPERADQSTWPTLVPQSNVTEVLNAALDASLEVTDGNERILASSEKRDLPQMSGPHNIARCVGEFALSYAPQVRVYLGSPADIVATLRVRTSSDPVPALIDYEPALVGPSDRLRLVPGARELMRRATSIGLDISERTAHRILADEIAPLSDVATILMQSTCVTDPTSGSEPADAQSSSRPERTPTDIYRDMRGLKISSSDLNTFSVALRRAFDDLAQQYYLELEGEPGILVRGDKITVTFNFKKID